MSKLNIALAGAIALALAGAAKADDPRDNNTRQDQTQDRDDHSRSDNPRERDDQTRQEQSPQDQPGGDMGGSQQAHIRRGPSQVPREQRPNIPPK